MFASCGDCGHSRVKEDERARYAGGRDKQSDKVTPCRMGNGCDSGAKGEGRGAKAKEGGGSCCLSLFDGSSESKRPLEAMRYGAEYDQVNIGKQAASLLPIG